MYLQEICELLETYSGRDKVMRTLCYSTKLISGLTTDNKLVSERFKIFSSQMSATRTVLRLFDDLPMLKFLLEYGLGRNEPDRYMATLGVVTNVIDQIYYPIEKVAWLAENRLISIENSEPWDVASSICWVASIYLTLMKSLRYVHILQKHKTCFHAASDSSVTKLQLKSRLNMEILTCIRLSLDLVHAVNTLPPGCFWSGKLNTWQVGLIGTLSSILGLYQLFAKKAMNKSKSS